MLIFKRTYLLTITTILWWSKKDIVCGNTEGVILPNVWIGNLTDQRWFGSRNSAHLNLSFTFKNQSVYVVPKPVAQLILYCNASYPILWNLADSEINPEMFHWMRMRSIRSVTDVFDPSTFEYSSQLVLSSPSSSHKFTGNYSCQSTANAAIQTNVFVFWQGSDFLVHSKEKLTAYLENDLVILPCGISSPEWNKIPKLRKEHEKGPYEEISTNKSVEYRLTIGFILKNVSYPVGRYKCLFGDGKEDFVIVNVQKPGNKKESNATFTYNDENKELVCCSSSRRTPSLVSLPCEHAVTCQFREHVLQPFHHIFSRSKKKGSCASKSLRSGYHSGLFRCIGDGIDKYKETIAPIQSVFLPWNSVRNTTTFFSWEEIDSQDMLTILLQSQRMTPNEMIRSKPKNPIYSKQRILMECHTSSYYFSEGVQWLIRWKNKSLTLPNDQPPTASGNEIYLGSSNDYLNIPADPNMDAVVCLAPVWNSSIWVTKAYFLFINESILPNLTNSKVENLSWYTNETGKSISCEASGTPNPSISWKKGEQNLNLAQNYEIVSEKNPLSNATKSTLKIRRVSYLTQGEYTCVVTNYAGVVSKLFQIKVMETSSWGTVTTLVVSGFIIFFLIAVIFYVIHRLKKDQKAIQHLTSVHFKEPAVREETIEADVNNIGFDNGKMNNQLLN